MKPVFTTGVGDCFRACVASILELRSQDVPHTPNTTPEDDRVEWIANMNNYLRPLGLAVIYTVPEDGYKQFEEIGIHNCYYIMCVSFESGPLHAIVGRNGNVTHDPARSGPLKYKKVEGYFFFINLMNKGDNDE